MEMRFLSGLLLAMCLAPACLAQSLAPAALSGDGVWIDPAFEETNFRGNPPGSFTDRATIWFDTQLLGTGESYLTYTQQWANRLRSDLRPEVIGFLKNLNTASMAAAQSALDALEAEGLIRDVRPHWIVNGFTCVIEPGAVEQLAQIPHVKKIFRALPKPAQGAPALNGPSFVTAPKPSPIAPASLTPTWNQEQIGATQVWQAYDLTGRGTLHVIHDFGFKLDVPPLAANVYRNPHEIPDNDRDDDGNGLVDDYHGYDFDNGTPHINSGGNGNIIHGNVVAGLVAGTTYTDANTTVAGLAPGASWAGVLGVYHIEEAIEWALDHGADTYNMSFSLPGLQELRSHWRKVLEQAALSGLFIMSGAGNFANPNSTNYAPVPVQMRTPEDIPHAVFGPAGVTQALQWPSFSSQGPVVWETEHYQDGEIQKPDLATFNANLPYMGPTGNLLNGVNGNSFAGPHLAGVLGLMLEADPDLTPWAAREILQQTATDVLAPGVDFQSGYGFVNAYAAVTAVLARKASRTTSEQPKTGEATRLHPNYPNPTPSETILSYTLPHDQPVRLEIRDLLGRTIEVLDRVPTAAGTHRIAFNTARLSAGLYLYQLHTPSQILTRPLTVVR